MGRCSRPARRKRFAVTARSVKRIWGLTSIKVKTKPQRKNAKDGKVAKEDDRMCAEVMAPSVLRLPLWERAGERGRHAYRDAGVYSGRTIDVHPPLQGEGRVGMGFATPASFSCRGRNQPDTSSHRPAVRDWEPT